MMKSNEPENLAVLVVEDDPLLRLNAVDIVLDAGFTAYEAANADEGMSLLERHRDVRILFTDIDMPGSMDGLALARTVRRRWPPLGILVASGHIRIREEDMPEGGLFIPKPYPPSVLTRALQSVVEMLPPGEEAALAGASGN